MLVEDLTELKLHGCRLNDSINLHSLLRLSPNLQVLEFTRVASGAASLLNALAAHYFPSSASNLHVLGDDPPCYLPPILCPKLTHVDFSGCPEVRAGLLMRFIKSRLIGDEPARQTSLEVQPSEVSKIESLIIDSCPNVEKEWVTRMEKARASYELLLYDYEDGEESYTRVHQRSVEFTFLQKLPFKILVSVPFSS